MEETHNTFVNKDYELILRMQTTQVSVIRKEFWFWRTFSYVMLKI